MNKALWTATAALAFAPFALADDHDDKFSAMDADGDNAVTEAEFVTYATAGDDMSADEASLQFAVIAGSDGVLTREELDAVMEVRTDDAAETDGDTNSADPAETEGE